MPKGKLKPEDEQTIRENYFLLREELDAKDLVEFLCQHKVLADNDKQRIISKKIKSERNDLLLSLILNAGSGDGFQLFMTSIEKHFKNLHSRLQDIAKQKIWSANQIKKAKEFEQEKEQYDKEKAEWIDRLKQLQETNSAQSKKIEDQDAKIQLLTDENTKLKEEIKKYKEEEQAKSREEEIQNVISNASRKETNISVKDTILKGLKEEREKILKNFTEAKKQTPPDDRIALLEKRLHQLVSVRPVKKSVTFDFDTDAMPSDSSKIYLFQEDEPLSIHAANSLLKEAHVLRELTLARENRNFALEQKLEKKDVLKDVLEKEISVLIYEIEKLSERFRDTTENFLKEKKSLEGKLLAEENKQIMISKDLENKKNELQERLKESSELIQQIEKNFSASVLLEREKTRLEGLLVDKDNNAGQLNKKLGKRNNCAKFQIDSEIVSGRNDIHTFFTRQTELNLCTYNFSPLPFSDQIETLLNYLLSMTTHESLSNQLKENSIKKIEFESVIKNLEKLSKTSSDELQKLQDERLKLTGELKVKENENNFLLREIEKLKEQAQQSRTEIKDLEKRCKDTEKERDALLEQTKLLQGSAVDKQNNMEELKNKLDKTNSQLKELTDRNKELETNSKSSGNEKLQLVGEKAQLEQQKIEQSNKILAMKKKIRHLKNMIKKLTLDIKDLENIREEAIFQQKRNEILSRELETFKSSQETKFIEIPEFVVESNTPPKSNNRRGKAVNPGGIKVNIPETPLPSPRGDVSRRDPPVWTSRPSTSSSVVSSTSPAPPMLTSATRRRQTTLTANSTQLLANEKLQKEKK